jgi:D-glycero-alpha-D-manno-heptose-7-phosphate kinase
MIISRTPVRIPLGGGGTDLPAYYEQYGASLLTGAVNKYVFIFVKEHFEKTIRFAGYHRKEVADSPEKIEHPVVREALRMLNIDERIEIVSVADVPANTGLGTSSSFTVGLLNALHTFKDENPSSETLAREAVAIERVILKEPGGVQDQYIAAYGNIISIEINTAGDVAVSRLKLDSRVVAELERRLIFFYTKLQRTASEIQGQHVETIKNGNGKAQESLHEIKRIGLETREALQIGDLDHVGRLLDEHWNFKKRISSNVSSDCIDRWYKVAVEAGALGGKLVGAGGGGFLMFYCHPDVRDRVSRVLAKEKLQEIDFRFDFCGSRILVNI